MALYKCEIAYLQQEDSSVGGHDSDRILAIPLKMVVSNDSHAA